MTFKSSAIDWQTLGLFAAASAITVGLGSYGLSLSGAEFGTWSRNPFAWLTGMVLSVPLILVGRRRGFSPAIVVIAIVALAASLMAPGQSGVHRWLDLGPVNINVAALLLPVAIIALSGLALSPATLLAAIVVIGAILVAQPDASQATAFLLAASLILLGRTMSKALLMLGLLMTCGLAVAAWLRPDPLQPVPEAEGIFGLIADISMPLAIAAGLALALTCLAPLRRLRSGSESGPRAATALTIYFCVTAIMPFLGPYPVPLVGVGMSFPVGFWLGMALLCARGRPNLR
jgi:cell division protein FtsW (lipid II flippase)